MEDIQTNEPRPFIDMVMERLEDHAELKAKYADTDSLTGDPMMQTAVWAIMNAIDARERARRSFEQYPSRREDS